MLIAERHRRILEMLQTSGVVSMNELAGELDTSVVTIRRDLRALAADGMLRRTRGGALAPGSLAYEPTYAEKAGQLMAEKQAIAEEALTLIERGDFIEPMPPEPSAGRRSFPQ